MEEQNQILNRVAIIDIDSLLFSSCWGNKIPIGNGEFKRDDRGRLIYQEKTEEEISESIDKDLHTILEDTKATHYIIYVKGNNTASHRYAVKSDYKANRPAESPSWWEFAKNYIIENWKAVSSNDIESDDSCNIARLMIPNSFMVAIDKDLLNLEGSHYNWKLKKWIDTSRFDELLFFYEDMIAGQPGDGISGLKGLGKAYYKKIINSALEVFKEDDLYLELPAIILKEYIKFYGTDIGVQEYYKNYTCLKILENYENFVLPEPIPYKFIEKESIFDDLFKDDNKR